MAGGTFNTQNKVRPGAYINFGSEPKPLSSVADRGIMTIPLILPFGPSKQVISIENSDNLEEILGFNILDESALLIKEGFKRAKTILLYRLNEGTKASATIGSTNPLTITATQGGILGNEITIVILEDIDTPGTFIVTTLLKGKEVDKQTVTKAADLKPNFYVTFSSTVETVLVATAGTPLKAGSDGTVTNAEYLSYLTSIELYEWNTMALPSDDETLKPVFASFIKRLREDEGKKVQVALPSYPIADYEGIISVKNGVVLSDGTVIDKTKATSWVAGATAGAFVNQSNTYTAYDGAVDVDVKHSNKETIEALQNGEFLFTAKGEKAIVEQDINTFTSFTVNKGKDFSKNRLVRTMDSINNDSKRIWEDYYIGKVDNDADGRTAYRGDLIHYMGIMQSLRAIQNFNPDEDIKIDKGIDIDAVTAEIGVQGVDSMEKLYMTVKMR